MPLLTSARAHRMSDRGWVVGMVWNEPSTRAPALRSMLKPWHSPIDTPRLRSMHAAAGSNLSSTSLAMSFEFGNDLGLPRCVRLEIRTMMCTFLGKQVVVAIAVDR